MDPLTTYYLPKILDTVGGLPEGATFDIPQPPPAQALYMSLSEFSMFGVVIVVLITMGTIAGERQSGVAELVLVKPVGYFTYISSKWAAKLLLIWSSYIVGMLASWYYVNLLFGEIAFTTVVQVILFYGLWLTLVTTITIFFNTLVKTPLLVGFLSIAVMIAMSVVNSVFSHRLIWFPNNLSSYILQMMDTGTIPTDLWATALIIIGLIVVLLVAALFTFRTREMAN